MAMPQPTILMNVIELVVVMQLAVTMAMVGERDSCVCPRVWLRDCPIFCLSTPEMIWRCFILNGLDLVSLDATDW